MFFKGGGPETLHLSENSSEKKKKKSANEFNFACNFNGGGGYVVKIGEGHCHVPIVQQVDMLDPNVNVDHENALIQ